MSTQTTGTVMDGLLETIEDQNRKLRELDKALDKERSETLKNSMKYNGIRAQLAMSNLHLFNFLDEMEARFDNTSEFDSPEICRDYMDAAKYTAQYFGRLNNRYDQAKHWYDNYSLPFKS
jgi:hypothetical protein